MRETRNAQRSVFENYSKHEYGVQLMALSQLLDEHGEILQWAVEDLGSGVGDRGARGLSVESVFRCLLLKQILNVSYDRLAFVLSDSGSCRTFARLSGGQCPSRSGLQSTIRQISAATLEKVNRLMMQRWTDSGDIGMQKLRVDSTVVQSNIAVPSDSQLLTDGIRVLSRMMANSREATGVKLRFVDQRARSRTVSFRIFNAKKAEKELLYPQLLSCTRIVIKQVDRAVALVEQTGTAQPQTVKWIKQVQHYRSLLLKVVDQTTRRVIDGRRVASGEKIVSLFEEHTDIIVKGQRDVQYGHKINVGTQEDGFITYMSIEKGNPSDTELFMPVLESLREYYAVTPRSTVGDGGYATRENVLRARAMGVKQAVFHKRVGLRCHEMGVKEKTLKKLRDFRAGIEGNISELKRVFGARRATWKGREGFDAYVWSCVLSYNLIRRVRFDSG